MGEIDVPADRYLGAQTQRSLVHFSIGDDKASAIAHKANDQGLTLKEAALASGDIDEKRFDEIVDPKKDGRARRRRKLKLGRPWHRRRRSTSHLV
jgi:fumarate hydratase class II